MNKQIILSALQTQLETVKANAIAHEQNVYQPAMDKLTAKIKEWFDTNIGATHSVELGSETISIKPNDSNSYGSNIDINYRGNWRGDGGYFEVSSYRPDIKSTEDNTHATHYYTIMCNIAINFDAICKRYKHSWLPAITKLKDTKSEQYSSIWQLEKEIRTCEAEIATIEKEIYNKTGFECTLKPMTNYNSNYDNGDCVYTKVQNDHHIKAFYGRSKWDYAYINSFKVVSFPKAKHAKVVIQWKSDANDQTRTTELNKTRYAEFIDEVYNWQTKGAAAREESVDERVARYNKTEA
ncbi:MAG: hypothetical protein EBU08_12045 [Micrococcales bacterium]|nr:hypothetical protein [Micrococcales bacterium]